VKFETLTYAAGPTDFSVGLASGSQEARQTSSEGGLWPARLSVEGLAAFLLRVAAYFQGCLASLPRIEQNAKETLTLIDTSLDNTSGPLIKVRMNRTLSRRMRWLIKRGRAERSGEMRVYSPEEGRCNLTPGQFLEYGIRVHGMSRVRVYRLRLGRRALRIFAVISFALQGDRMCLGRMAFCSAPISPD